MNLAQLKGRLDSLYQRIAPGCIVLCYHRVSEQTKDHWRNVVSVANFRGQIKMLGDNYQLLSMDQVVESLSRGRFPERRTIAVTFDDGYAANLGSACNILVDRRAPVSFYLTTEWLNTGEYFWWDQLQTVFGDGALADTTSLQSVALELDLPWKGEIQQSEFFSLLRSRLKVMDQANRKEVLGLVAGRLGGGVIATVRDHAPASSKDVVFLSREPLFTIGGHTHTHPSLSHLRRDRQRDEIRQNKQILESIIGKQIHHFSYPFGGREDFDDATMREVKDAGFGSAVTMIKSPLRLDGDSFKIPRISVKDWTAARLKSQLHDLWGQ